MKRNEILAYTFDFIRLLLDKLENEIEEIILFGSVAVGEFGPESDVDLFINTKNIKAIQATVRRSLEEFESVIARTWALRGIRLPIKCIVGDLSSPRWAELKREIIGSGITLFGKYKELPKGLQHSMIFSFSLASLKPSVRVKIIRQLYGYTSRKGKKVYKHKGLLQEVGGFKFNPGTIVVPATYHKKVCDFFKLARVRYKVYEVWM